MIRFEEKLKAELKNRGLSLSQLEVDTGIRRSSFAPSRAGAHRPSTMMALAYYLGTAVEELVAGTDLEDHWYDRTGARTQME